MKEKNNKKYGLVLFLVLIVIVLAVIKVKYGWKESNNVQQQDRSVPTETISITPTEASSTAKIIKVDESKYPLWEELPYSGEGFTVEKYTAPKVLTVQLNGATRSLATKAINVWLEGFGDVGKGHKIEFEN